jgi:tetratricopeptide (TPR) repeat protein
MRKFAIVAIIATLSGCSRAGISDKLVGQAALHATSGDFRGAIVLLDQAVEDNPSNTVAYTVRGTAYRKLGDYQRAIDDCTKAIQLDPTSDAAFCQRAFAYQESDLPDHVEHAFADANESIKLNHNGALAYVLRGNALLERKEYQPAIDDFTRATELSSQSFAGYGGRARVYRAMGEMANARAEIRKALLCNPPAEDKTQLLAIRDTLGSRP